MRCLFVTEIGDDYYEMKQFDRVIDYYQNHYHICRLEDKNGKRSILISGVTTVRQAVSILKQMR